jgi:hypothetical protein
MVGTAGVYEVPPVFEEAHAAGFRGFSVAAPPDVLLDPADPSRAVPASGYTHETIINGRTQQADKECSTDKIREWAGRADSVLGAGQSWSQVALIGGMPVQLTTNSTHLINFWRWNWYLADEAEVERALRSHADVTIVKMRAAIEKADSSTSQAFYCRETNETVFWNTDYYGQCKSWALGAAGAELIKYDVHSIHGAAVDVSGRGILIVAPTGTGKSTYTNALARVHQVDSRYRGRVNSDDWVYVKDGVAFPSERNIYVRTNAVADDIPDERMNHVMKHMRSLFDAAPCENVPLKNGRRLYSGTPNSRAMISPAEISEMTFATPISLVILLRRNDYSPFEEELDTATALKVLEEGEYTVQPGSGPKEKWGQISYEPWYNPYLLRPDYEFERRKFAELSEQRGARYVIYNTGAGVCAREFGVEKRPEELTREDYEGFIQGTVRRMLARLEEM